MPVISAADREGSSLEGAAHGATISLILDHSQPGDGPRLHRHPYDETWVVQEGNLTSQPDPVGPPRRSSPPAARQPAAAHPAPVPRAF
ncbi:MAG: hypothetical protein M3025_08800 [Actinomycetota bacterium]|nr:hypothetical protein [Actinomycetota bacterium]